MAVVVHRLVAAIGAVQVVVVAMGMARVGHRSCSTQLAGWDRGGVRSRTFAQGVRRAAGKVPMAPRIGAKTP
jgi:hypothetical protein